MSTATEYGTLTYTALGVVAVTAVLFLLSQPTGLGKWLKEKNYQYELTSGLYMLSPPICKPAYSRTTDVMNAHLARPAGFSGLPVLWLVGQAMACLFTSQADPRREVTVGFTLTAVELLQPGGGA